MNRRAWHASSLLLAAVAMGCGDSTGPSGPQNLTIVFVDAQNQLFTLRAGNTPVPTELRDVQPFAPSNGALWFLPPHGEPLRILHLDGRVDTLEIPSSGGARGAISPDGGLLAYSRRSSGRIYLTTVNLVSGHRDSVDVTGRADAVAADQILGKTPVFSPSGDTVAFLLPNIIGMQVFLYEVATRRIEVFPVPIPVITFARVLDGWPRWTSDEGIRFLARRHVSNSLTDTVMVMRVFPREPERVADVLYWATPPDSLSLDNANTYSFSADGETVVFSVVADGVSGIFAVRRGSRTMQPLVYRAGTAPRLPLLIP